MIGYVEQLSQESTLTISSVTAMEIIAGCRNKQHLKICMSFVKSFSTAQITESVSKKAVELMKVYYLSHGLLQADALIAATALKSSMPLLTLNQKDFRFIEEITLLPTESQRA